MSASSSLAPRRPRIRARPRPLAAAVLLAWACSGRPSPAREEAPAEIEKARPAPPAAPEPASATPAGPITLRCGDLLTPDDLDAAGVDPSRYDPDKRAAPGLGVNCVVGSPAVTLFEGEQYASLIEGFKTMGPQSGLAAAEGPSVGSAHQWTTMGPITGLMFRSTNRRYAANLSGSDMAQLERLARAIDARMSKR